MKSTQIKLIEAAEQEFAEHGYHGSSIRGITTSAGANVAAVNYHFGSKESLFIEMVRYRIDPVNQLRIAMLDQALDANNGRALELRTIVDILIRPLITAFMTPDRCNFMRAMGRALSEESSFMATLYNDILAELITRFRSELGRTLADLPPLEVEICFHYLGCTLSGSMLQQRRLEDTEKSDLPNLDPDEVTERLVTYITGGIEAIAQSQKSKLENA